MSHLACDPLSAKSAQEVALQLNIAMPTVSKILKNLLRCGLVRSIRGARGGYLLAYPPDNINLAQVIDALEGPIALTECSAVQGACAQASVCSIRANWQGINHQVRQILENMSLLSMLQPQGQLLR